MFDEVLLLSFNLVNMCLICLTHTRLRNRLTFGLASLFFLSNQGSRNWWRLCNNKLIIVDVDVLSGAYVDLLVFTLTLLLLDQRLELLNLHLTLGVFLNVAHRCTLLELLRDLSAPIRLRRQN